MRMTANLPDHGAILEGVLAGFVAASAAEIAAGIVPPFPDQTGVKYREEGSGEEQWKLPHETLADGQGDCEDLAIWECGGWHVSGGDPGARVVLMRTGDRKLHAVVLLSSGDTSDPSARLRSREKGGRPYLVGGGLVIHDHRATPGGGGDVAPGAPRAAQPDMVIPGDPNAAATNAYMKARGIRNLNVTDTAGRAGARGGIPESIYQAAIQEGINAQRYITENPYLQALAEATQHATSQGVSVDATTFGKPLRGQVSPDDFQFLPDEAGGHYERYPANALLATNAYEMPDDYGFGDPWGYGGQYGYGGDMYGGFGFGGYGGDYWGTGGDSPYGWQWGDGPLLTYDDLYGGPTYGDMESMADPVQDITDEEGA
jgi:hypothetical protein